MALGTGALVEFPDAQGQPTIDYIRGDLIFPLRWEGDHITECAFGSRRVFGSGANAAEGYYVQVHAREPDGYVIRNAWLDEQGSELPPPEGVETVGEPSPVPLFQILRPNMVNAAALWPLAVNDSRSTTNQIRPATSSAVTTTGTITCAHFNTASANATSLARG